MITTRAQSGYNALSSKYGVASNDSSLARGSLPLLLLKGENRTRRADLPLDLSTPKEGPEGS